MWVFEVWDCIPGPAESDFHCSYTTHEEALKAVQECYIINELS